jgi:hypothetical protein
MKELVNYFGAVLEDGDYLNDWLTHFPEWAQVPIEFTGKVIANIGFAVAHVASWF